MVLPYHTRISSNGQPRPPDIANWSTVWYVCSITFRDITWEPDFSYICHLDRKVHAFFRDIFEKHTQASNHLSSIPFIWWFYMNIQSIDLSSQILLEILHWRTIWFIWSISFWTIGTKSRKKASTCKDITSFILFL